MSKQLQTTIYSLAFGGSGVGKVDGKVCFVDGALPGEEVIFDVIRDNSKYIKGTISKVLMASGDRIDPVCEYYGKCGGCQTQHLTYEKELMHKKTQFEELIKRIAGIGDFKCETIVPSSTDYNYRSSITVNKNDKGKYGFYSQGEKAVIEIKKCTLAAEAINNELPVRRGKDSVTLKADYSGMVWSSDRMGERFFLDRYRDTDIYMSPKAFSQPNRDIAVKIVETLEEWIGDDDDNSVFFDVYCGVGFFSFLLRNNFFARIGIDSNRVAIDCAKNTAKKHKNSGENVKFYKGEAGKVFFDIFERNKKDNNIILLDPSRAGVDRGFLEKVRDCREINKIFYLSCDPARLARDIEILTKNSGWTLGRVLPFDMFPRTKHIEALVEFKLCA